MSIAVVGAALANKPSNAGAAWTRLSWVRGLAAIGFDTHLVERLAPAASSEGVAWFRAVTTWAGLGDRAVLLDNSGRPLSGHAPSHASDLLSSAALVVNVSGHLPVPPRSAGGAGGGTRWVYLDLDPGYTQVWHHEGLVDLEGHDHFFTVGELVGTPACDVPTGDVEWHPVRQPVVLEDWPAMPPPESAPFTTVGAWRGPYGVIEHRGRSVGGKVHEFRRIAALPRHVPAPFEVALDIDEADAKDRALMEEGGWRVVIPRQVAGDPDAFRCYLQASRAEASVAQGVYVHARTGWFGDRSVRYLASGRPVLVQDTGFSRTLPVGEGILPFGTLEEAARGACAIVDDPARHATAARRLAEELFAAPTVLGGLCEEVGVGP